MDNWQALQSFWSGFGLPAYDEQTVFPEGYSQAYPHITYEAASGVHGSTGILSASIWDRILHDEETRTWKLLKQKADEIKQYIGYGGCVIRAEGGGIWIKLPESSPFSHPMPSGNDDILRIEMSIEVDFIGEK